MIDRLSLNRLMERATKFWEGLGIRLRFTSEPQFGLGGFDHEEVTIGLYPEKPERMIYIALHVPAHLVRIHGFETPLAETCNDVFHGQKFALSQQDYVDLLIRGNLYGADEKTLDDSAKIDWQASRIGLAALYDMAATSPDLIRAIVPIYENYAVADWHYIQDHWASNGAANDIESYFTDMPRLQRETPPLVPLAICPNKLVINGTMTNEQRDHLMRVQHIPGGRFK